ncbi:MAG: UvrD-helicase domain-containing protein, partial [Planctomycetota bacterium]
MSLRRARVKRSEIGKTSNWPFLRSFVLSDDWSDLLSTTRKIQTESTDSRTIGIERIFLGWDEPVLNSTVERLLRVYRQEQEWDLRQLTIVLPGGLAAHRLEELLALKSQTLGLTFYPPTVLTTGQLPERLYRPKHQFATELVQHLSWMQALQATSTEVLQHLIPVPPPTSASSQWLELGKTIAKLHRELASELLDFQAVVENLPPRHVEAERWSCLAELQSRYHAILDQLSLWDIQTARLVALKNKEPQDYARNHPQKVLVVGCVDLNSTQRGFLDAIAPQAEVWVAAPASEKRMFDEYGCLELEKWQQHVLSIPSKSLLVGNGPRDQVELAAACIADLQSEYASTQISVGVADNALLPELRHRFDLCGVPTRYGPGDKLPGSEPVKLLSLIGKFLEGRSYLSFAALVRHPAVSNLLHRQARQLPSDWLAKLDSYYQESLPKRIDKFVDKSATGADEYMLVVKTIDKWLAKLTRKPQKVALLVQPLLHVLRTCYDRITCDLDDEIESALYAAAKTLAKALVELRDVPQTLQPELTATEVIDWLVQSLAQRQVSELPDPDRVELLGWLDLALDDAPALIVTGVHDGVVPEALNADPFLPNSLRKQLGMADNERRLARDLYAAQVMLKTRDSVTFVTGKVDAKGDPVTPSRLLMACELQDLPARILHLTSDDHSDTPAEVVQSWSVAAGSKPALEIPRPAADLRPKHVTVTAFRDYLQCPYRYYLRHVLRLKPQDDSLAELQASQFGVLIHDALEQLVGPMGSCTDEEQIAEFLISHLHQSVAVRFGEAPAAPVLIQIEQAELRLKAFARSQAQRAEEGWEILFTESGVDAKDELRIGNHQELCLVGRVDRIDYHPDLDLWAIWDYKTSESAKDPVQVHWSKSKGWLDLQLPLYRHLARKLGIDSEPMLGYISLPKQASKTRFYAAEFSQEQLREADMIANDVVTRIASGKYWPDEWETPTFDDYARICQTNSLEVRAAKPTKRCYRFDESTLGSVDESSVREAEILQLQPVVSDPNLSPKLIRASAGTGKTFQLTNRLLQIILSGQKIDSILATTFTRKAAGEIQHRVLSRLAEACLHADKRAELAEHLDGVDTSAAACLYGLRRITQEIHRFRIATLDSFFSHIARVFSFEMGLPNGWEPMNPVQERAFQMQAIGSLLEQEDRQTLVNLVRMLAKGESSRRVADEILQTVGAGFSVYRSTEAEAWDQLPLLPATSEAAHNSALHTIASTKLGHTSADRQLEKIHLMASTGDWEGLLDHKLAEAVDADTPKYYKKEIPSDLVLAIQQVCERAACELLPQRKAQTLASYEVLSKYDGYYQDLLKRYRLLAFADVTYFLSNWSERSANQSEVMQRLEFRMDCGIRHLLLDEFQDTAADQWRILEPIAKPLALQKGAQSEQSIFCVGDTKQAIYGWRGGVAEVFDAVTAALPNIEQQQLNQSFRSSQSVIDSVNEVFANLEQHENYSDCENRVGAWSGVFPNHATARSDLAGYV